VLLVLHLTSGEGNPNNAASPHSQQGLPAANLLEVRRWLCGPVLLVLVVLAVGAVTATATAIATAGASPGVGAAGGGGHV
jgi:hypothetical protein